MKPVRLRMAQALCRYLPPLIAQRVRDRIYSREEAYRDDYQFTVRATTGSSFRYTTSDYPSYPFVVHGYFTWRAWAIARAVCASGDTIVEVGANVGTETIGFADIVGERGKVFAFEPLPSNLEVLRHNVTSNGQSHVRSFPLAVGASCQTVRFSIPTIRKTTSTSHVVNLAEADRGNTIEVACVSLDSLAESLGKVKLLFVDAEGAELDIVKGAKQFLAADGPFWVVEVHEKLSTQFGYGVRDVFDAFTDADYAVFQIGRFGLTRISAEAIPVRSDWFCLHKSRLAAASKVDRYLMRCGLMPCIKRLNPLVS